jgi:hypothetical protein
MCWQNRYYDQLQGEFSGIIDARQQLPASSRSLQIVCSHHQRRFWVHSDYMLSRQSQGH